MRFSRETQTFVRPEDTTQYGAGDLVANSATAGSVVPLTFNARPGQPWMIRGVHLYHTDEDATNSAFRVWFLSTSPTVTDGDNGALAGINVATVLGTIEITADENCGDTFGATLNSDGILVPGGTFYALVQATAAYTPGNAETFGVTVVMERA
jgi:hypothetical protein